MKKLTQIARFVSMTIGLFCCLNNHVLAQTYTLTPYIGAFTPIVGGTNVPSIQVHYNQGGHSDPINIGFNFSYEGNIFTQVKAYTSYGLEFLGWESLCENKPVIAPLWHELSGIGGTATYKTTGTAPNRVFTFEWLNWRWGYYATAASISFQVKLYETTNRIEMVYRQEAGAIDLRNSDFIAFSARIYLYPGNSRAYYLSDGGINPTLYIITEEDNEMPAINVTSKPANGQTYQFNLIIKPEPTNHVTNFAVANKPDSIALSWTDAIGTNLPEGYLIMVSKTNTFTPPIDAVSITDDNDLSDGFAMVKVPQGIQAYKNFKNIIGSNTYYVRIYPYSNRGSFIDYKITEPVPQVQKYILKPQPLNHVSNFSIGINSGNYLLNWNENNTGADGYLILASTTNTFPVVANGTDVVIDHNLSDGAGVVKVPLGTTSYSSWTNINTILPHYFKMIPYNNSGSEILYNQTLPIPQVQLLPKPTQHATNFTATSAFCNIILNWTDAPTSPSPEGYLLIGSSGTIVAPVDGVDFVEDKNLYDGIGYVKIANNKQTFSGWEGMASGTTYNFAIYPYANSGTNILYKTNVTAPLASSSIIILPEPIRHVTNFTASNIGTISLNWEDAYRALGNQSNNALNFDGSNDYVDLGTLSPTGNFTTGFSYMGWIKWGSFNSWSRLLDIGTGQGVNNILIANNSTTNTITFTNHVGTTPYQFTTTNTVTANQWVHISATISSTGVGKIYINGVLASTMSNMQIPANIARNKCYLGRSNWTSDAYFNGSMDDVSIWTKELTATEINTYMSSPPAGNESGLYANYTFNQGVAGANNTGITSLPDNTSNAKNGTLTNFTLTAPTTSNWVSSLQEPSGYLIKAYSSAQNYTPYDYNQFDYDNDLSDGYASVSVDYGTKTYSGFTRIEGSNTYYFYIWPYTNHSYYINYKTDGTIPSTSISYIKPAPITQVTNFSVSENNQILELNWTDAAPIDLNNAIALDGTDDYIEVPELGNNLNEFTIETWINPSLINLSGFNGIFNSNTWNLNDLHLQLLNGNLRFDVNGGNGLSSTYQFQTNQWQHIAFSYSTISGKAYYYINGIKTDSINLTNAKNVNLTAARIGSWAGGGRFFDGKFDEYRVWNKVRSQNEIATNMYAELASSESGLLAYYKFNQGVAFANNNGITAITDNSGNNKNGSLTNSALSGSTSNWIRFVADAPDGYYIVASQNNAMPQPVNGVEPQWDLDLSDGAGIVRIPQGIQTFASWNHSETYDKWYFHIFPYNNSSSNILYNNQLPIVNDSISTRYYPFYEDRNFSLYQMMESMALWGDFDNNGELDILASGIDMYGSRKTYTFKSNGDKTFSYKNSISNNKGTIAWADYDNDNDLDFVVSGLNGSTPVTWIFKNTGSGFSYHYNSIIGVENGAVDWGDYNNDGFKDLIVTGTDDSYNFLLKIYTNNGSSGGYTFNELAHEPIEGITNGVVKWGDYDNDGFLDFILTGGDFYATQKNKTKIYKNNGNNTFTEQTNIILPTLIHSYAAWGDYDNDNDLDLLLGGTIFNGGAVAAVYRNDGNNTFTKQTDIALELSDRYDAFEWADYDNDGYLDIFQFVDVMEAWDDDHIIRQEESNTQIYRNNKNGNFSQILTDTASYIGGNMSFGDYDNDNDLDMLVTSKADNLIATKLYVNNDRSQNTPPTIPTGLLATQKADKVYFTWNRSTDNTTPKNIISYNIRIGTSDGASNTISAQAIATTGKLLLPGKGNVGTDTVFSMPLSLGTYYWSVQAIDNSYTPSNFATGQPITRVELAASNLNAEVRSTNSLMLRWDNGSYGNRVVFCKQANTGTSSPVNNTYYTADPYYGKGKQIGTSGWYCIFNGKADSTMVYGLNPNYAYMFHVVEYIDNNGLPSYTTNNGFGNPGCFGVAKFMEQASTLSGITKNLSAASTSWVDYNNDGYLDLYMAGKSEVDINSGYNLNESLLYTNNGDYSFSTQAIFNYVDRYTEITNVAWGDYNNDGYKDALTSYNWLDTSIYPTETKYFIKVYKNVNGSNFVEQNITNISPVQLENAKWADFNNDGYLDIIITGTDSVINNINYFSTKLFRNNGGNSFSELAIVFPVCSDIEWGDIDNDGDLDIVLSGNYNTKIFSNEGNTFTEQTQIELAQLKRSYVNLADFNKDGFIDILLFGAKDEEEVDVYKVKLYTNKGDGSFIEESTEPISTLFDGTVALGDYDNDGYIDILVSGYTNYFDWLEFGTPYSKLYRNTSFKTPNNGISFEVVQQTGLIGAGPSASSFGDYDNDGDLDYVIIGANTFFSQYTKLYTNNTIMRAGSYDPNTTAVAPKNLKKEPLRGGMLLSWDGVSSDETPILTMSYNIRVGTSPDSLNLYAPHFVDSASFKKRTVNQMGNTGLNTFYKVYNLPDLADGKYYYWQVQAIDGGFLGGEWSVVDSFQIEATQAYFSFTIECQNDTVKFSDESVAYDGIKAWQWDFGDGYGFSNEKDPKYVYKDGLLAHTVQLVVTNSKGKNDTITNDSVYVKPVPKVSFTATNGCGEYTTELKNSIPTSGLIESWLWDFGDDKTSDYGGTTSHVYTTLGIKTITLTATDTNGCSASTSHDIVITTKPNTTLTLEYGELINGSICLGDTIIYSVPADANYSYQWQREYMTIPEITNKLLVTTDAGNYRVIVTNNLAPSCADTSETTTITINEVPTLPDIMVENGVTTFCPGTELKLVVDNASSIYNYQWLRNGGFIEGANQWFLEGAFNSGEYSVIAANGACEAESEQITLTQKPQPEKPAIYALGPNVWIIGCTSQTATAYQWYYDEHLIPGATSAIYLANQNLGDYYVEINDGGECWSASDVINIPTGLISAVDELVADAVTVYPNPSVGEFQVNLGIMLSGPTQVIVFDAVGKTKIINEYENVNNFVVDLTGKHSGIYFCKVVNKGKMVILKFIKE